MSQLHQEYSQGREMLSLRKFMKRNLFMTKKHDFLIFIPLQLNVKDISNYEISVSSNNLSLK